MAELKEKAGTEALVGFLKADFVKSLTTIDFATDI
jgi:hypothetical protein